MNSSEQHFSWKPRRRSITKIKKPPRKRKFIQIRSIKFGCLIHSRNCYSHPVYCRSTLIILEKLKIIFSKFYSKIFVFVWFRYRLINSIFLNNCGNFVVQSIQTKDEENHWLFSVNYSTSVKWTRNNTIV